MTGLYQCIVQYSPKQGQDIGSPHPINFNSSTKYKGTGAQLSVVTRQNKKEHQNFKTITNNYIFNNKSNVTNHHRII